MSAVPAGQRPVLFSTLEILTTLRHMRAVRDSFRVAVRELQERMRSGHDGVHNAAAMELDTQLGIVDGIVRKLWEATGATGPP